MFEWHCTLLQNVQTGCGNHPPYLTGTGVRSREVMRPVLDLDHSPPVTNEWSHTSTPHIHFNGVGHGQSYLFFTYVIMAHTKHIRYATQKTSGCDKSQRPLFSSKAKVRSTSPQQQELHHGCHTANFWAATQNYLFTFVFYLLWHFPMRNRFVMRTLIRARTHAHTK